MESRNDTFPRTFISARAKRRVVGGLFFVGWAVGGGRAMNSSLFPGRPPTPPLSTERWRGHHCR